jgi:hypothetical protein
MKVIEVKRGVDKAQFFFFYEALNKFEIRT